MIPTPEQKARAAELYDALKAAGFAPFALQGHPMMPTLAREYLAGRYTAADVVHMVTNLDIFAGGALRSKVEADVLPSHVRKN